MTANEPVKQFDPNARRKDWPSNADVDLSNKVDQSYGDPAAGYLKGYGRIREITPQQALAWYNRSTQSEAKVRPMTSAEVDSVHQQWLAAERSPVSKLGFAPGKVYQSPNANLNIAGFQDPNVDKIWVDTDFKAPSIHEALHRGMSILRARDLLPKEITKGNQEEYVVRALVLRHLGEIETRENSHPGQIAEARMIPDEVLDRVEKIAAEYIAKKRPGGPR